MLFYLDKVDTGEISELKEFLKVILIEAEENGVSGNNLSTLKVLVKEIAKIFSIGIYLGVPTEMTSLRIDLTIDDKQTREKL